MLDRLLFSLGSAAIGGALVYVLWTFATRHLARRRASHKATKGAQPQVSEELTQQAASRPPAPPEPPRTAGLASEGLSDIRNSLAEVARAQVAIMERLEAVQESRNESGDQEDQVAARLVAMSAKLDTMAEGASAEGAVAQGMDALDGRLAAIEDRLAALNPGDDSAGRDEALAEVMDALASRLEGVETGIGSVLSQVSGAGSDRSDGDAQADALRAVLEAALPKDALSELESRLSEKLAALAGQLEAPAAAPDDAGTAALNERLAAIEAQLDAASEHRDGEREAVEVLSARLAGLKDQLESPTELAFSEEALAELQAGLRTMLEDSGEATGQGAALAEALAALETRLDRMLGQLDELASDRSVGRTLEMIGAISTLQTDTARLKGGIELGFEQIGEITGDSAERIAALVGRIAALETQIEAAGGADGAKDAEAMAARIAELIADRLASAPGKGVAETDTFAETQPESSDSQADGSETAEPRMADETPSEDGASAAADVESDAVTDDSAGETAPTAPQAPTLVPPAAALDDPGDDGARPERSEPSSLAAHARGGAEVARVESALLRARPGLATVIGRHAHHKPNGGDF